MSENFPFDTVDDFLAAITPKERTMPDDAKADAEIMMSEMPDKTPIMKQARVAAVALLGVGAFTQDRYVLLSAVIGTVMIECMRLWCDQNLRAYRNMRLREENVAVVQAAAQVKSTAIENQ